MIRLHDIAHDGKISFDEFKLMFRENKKPSAAEYDPFYKEEESEIEISDTRFLGQKSK